ncbi:MAG: YdcH family protein [Vicinamibacteria bacterium]|nr:YdcH family protein [Vicinamibacteria bacterium]
MTSHNGVTQESLLASNEEYRKLHQEHVELENRLKVLSETSVLTDAEQLEESKLKKLKLAGRDRMEEITRAAH